MSTDIDFSFLDEIYELSENGAIELIDMFVGQSNEWLDLFNKTINTKDHEDLSKALHKLRGQVAIMGLKKIESELLALEADIKLNKNKETYPKRLNHIIELLGNAMDVILKKRRDFVTRKKT